MQNQHLIPELIINLVDQFAKATSQNEKLSLEMRLQTIRDYLDGVLKKFQTSELDRHFPNRKN